jgi:hypothetical protein
VNFIENYFGISPDGGDHSIELLLIVMLASLIAAVSLYLSRA